MPYKFDTRKWSDLMQDLKSLFTLSELRELSGVAESVISRAANGDRVSQDAFVKLCNLAGKDPAEFYTREG